MSDFSRFKPTSSTLFTEPATIQNSDFDKRTSNIPVTVRNDAAYGSYRNYSDGTTQGRYLSSGILRSVGVALTTGVTVDIATLTLTRGKWDMRASVGFTPAATTVINRFAGGTSLTSATFPSADMIAFPSGGEAINRLSLGGIIPGNALDEAIFWDSGVFELTEDTVFYLVAFASFTVSTLTVYGQIRAVSVL